MFVNVLANMVIIFLDIYVVWRWRYSGTNRKYLVDDRNLFILAQTITGICLLAFSFSVDGVRFDFRSVLFAYSLVYLGKEITFPTIILVAVARFFFGDLTVSVVGLGIVIVYILFNMRVFHHIQARFNSLIQMWILGVTAILLSMPVAFVKIENAWPILRSYALLIFFASLFIWLISNFTDDLNNLYEISVRDGLTTLYNSRKLEEDLRKISENNSSYSILILDIDNFKKLNDTYGHTIGDRALEEIGVIFQQHKNELFDYYRYGGEEFVAIVFDWTGEKTLKLAEDIHALLVDIPLVSHEGNAIPVTASIGIAHRKPHEDMRVTLRRADEALYRAKREGKNRTVANDEGLNFDYLNYD